jgi:hypothetical protein
VVEGVELRRVAEVVDVELDGREALLGHALGAVDAAGDRAGRVVAVAAVGVEPDPVAELPAEQPVDRLARRLPGEVPQRQLDPRERDHEHPRLRAGEDLAAPQLLPAPLHVARVLPEQQRREELDHPDDAARAGVGIRLAEAADSLVGVDPHQGGVPVVGHHRRRDVDDPHRCPPQQQTGSVTAITCHIS